MARGAGSVLAERKNIPICEAFVAICRLEPFAPHGAHSFMNVFTDFLARLLRGVFKLVLVLAAVVFVLSFLAAALVVVLVASLLSLLSGRKPAPVVMFSRMRANSQRYTQGVWPGRPDQPAGEVVDVEVTEVPDSPGAASPAATHPDGQAPFLR
jgi:hypothetical protein